MNGPTGAADSAWHLQGPAGPYDEPMGAPLGGHTPTVAQAPGAPLAGPSGVGHAALETPPPVPMQQPGAQVHVEPSTTHYHRPAIPPVGGHLLGVSTLLVGVGGLLGIRFGGLYGGVAGSLFGGAAVNVYRAITFATHGTEESDREAVVSGTYALVTAGVASYIAWKVDQKSPGGVAATPNPERCARNASRRCSIRPAGP